MAEARNVTKKDVLDEPMFENGPTRRQVDEWKAKHKKVFVKEVGDITFIMRMLSRPEYKELMKRLTDPSDREEEISKICTLWPDNFDFSSEGAGYASICCDVIMEMSGFRATIAKAELL